MTQHPVALLVVIIGASIWLTLSDLQIYQNADSILPTLASLQHWTFFFWGQDRLGMFSPLLTLLIENPLANLLVKTWISVFLGLCSFFLLGQFVLGRRGWVMVGLVSTTLFVCFLPKFQLFRLLIEQFQYGESIFFGLMGLLVQQRYWRGHRVRWIVMGSILLVTSHWINIAVFFFLVPLVLSRQLLFGSPRAEDCPTRGVQLQLPHINGEAPFLCWQHPLQGMLHRGWGDTLLSTANLIFAFGANLLIRQIYCIAMNLPRGQYAPLPLKEWPVAWSSLLATFDHFLQSGLFVALAGLTLLGILSILSPQGRGALSWAGRSLLCLLITGVFYFLVIGTLVHVKINDYPSRYLILPMAVITIGFVAFNVILLRAALPRSLHATATIGLVAILFFGIAVTHRRPSVEKIHYMLIERWGGPARELLDSRSTHLAGNFWRVWPTIFLSHLLSYEDGIEHQVWGLTGRSQATAHLWRMIPESELRIGLFSDANPKAAKQHLAAFHFPPLEKVGETGALILMEASIKTPPVKCLH